ADAVPSGDSAPAGDAVPAGDSVPARATATGGGTATAVETATAADTASADGTALPGATAEAPPPPATTEKHRKLLHFTLPGCWGAIIFACLSFTPSLLPRGGLIQGVICGITAAIGYGLGVWAAAIWRAFANREPRQPRRWAWLTFIISAI